MTAFGVGGSLRLDFRTARLRLLASNFAGAGIMPRRIGFWRLAFRAVPIKRRQQREMQAVGECLMEIVEASTLVRRPRIKTVSSHDEVFARLSLYADTDIFQESFDVPEIELRDWHP